MPNELIPCPFCGNEASIALVSIGYVRDEITASFKVGCPVCKIYFMGNSAYRIENGYPRVVQDGYIEVIQKWNGRADNA